MQKFKTCNSSRMPKYSLIASAVLSATLLSSLPASQAVAVEKGYTNYISDSLEVPMRRGAGYKYKISRMLKSGLKWILHQAKHYQYCYRD